MFDRLQRLVAWLMNRVRVNRLYESVQDGSPVFIKRRRAGGSIAIWFGNEFLALAHSGVSMFVRAEDWVDWEIHCARLLYPERQPVKPGPGPYVVIPRIPGTSLRQLLRRNDASVEAFVAAARELRRVHQLSCSRYQGAWSHGDLHLDNVLYDPVEGRAVLLDFDTRHEFGLSPLQRHADDLKAMLLELVGMATERWLQLASALIEEYREPSVLAELDRQLLLPRGFARIFWHTRTNGARTSEVAHRLQSVREIVQRVAKAGSIGQGTPLCRETG